MREAANDIKYGAAGDLTAAEKQQCKEMDKVHGFRKLDDIG
jgi:hypothetical protein